MPYYRTRSFNRRRVRKSRVLSTKSIYSRKSANAQAAQIAALRKRVNKVYKVCQPEKKVLIESTAQQHPMDSSATGNTSFGIGALDIGLGTGDNQRIADKVIRKDYVYLTFEYFNNSDTGYHDSESSGTPVRVIFGAYKNKQLTAGAYPSLTGLVANYTSSGADATQATIAPLVNGITEEKIIYYDKTFILSTSRNQKVLKLRSPWYSCRWAPDGVFNHTFCVVLCGNLHWDLNFTETVQCNSLRKTVYTDA